MATFPENTSIACVFIADDPLTPVLNFFSTINLFRTLTGCAEVGVRLELAENKAAGRQLATTYFMDKSTADFLVFLDPATMPPDHGIEYLVREFEKDEKLGAICALAFAWPRGEPNILKKAGSVKLGGYSFPTFAPAMDEVGRHAIEWQGCALGNPVMVSRKVIETDCFNGGLFAVRREMLKGFDGLYFHERRGYHMGTFCNKVRQLGYNVKAAMHIICSGGGANHLTFLQNYGKEKS